MKLEVRTPTAAEAEGVGKLWRRSFNEDVLNLNLFPRLEKPATVSDASDIYASDGYVELRHPAAVAWRQERLLEIISKNDQGRRLRIVVDKEVKDSQGGERIVGYAGWISPKVLLEPEDKDGEKEENKAAQETLAKTVEGFDMALLERYRKATEEEKAKHVGTAGEHWELALLCVDPSYSRKGIGRMLLQEGLLLAGVQGRVVYSEATPAGLPLYVAEGFEELGEIIFDNLAVGGSYRIVPIIKRPTTVPRFES